MVEDQKRWIYHKGSFTSNFVESLFQKVGYGLCQISKVFNFFEVATNQQNNLEDKEKDTIVNLDWIHPQELRNFSKKKEITLEKNFDRSLMFLVLNIHEAKKNYNVPFQLVQIDGSELVINLRNTIKRIYTNSNTNPKKIVKSKGAYPKEPKPFTSTFLTGMGQDENPRFNKKEKKNMESSIKEKDNKIEKLTDENLNLKKNLEFLEEELSFIKKKRSAVELNDVFNDNKNLQRKLISYQNIENLNKEIKKENKKLKNEILELNRENKKLSKHVQRYQSSRDIQGYSDFMIEDLFPSRKKSKTKKMSRYDENSDSKSYSAKNKRIRQSKSSNRLSRGSRSSKDSINRFKKFYHRGGFGGTHSKNNYNNRICKNYSILLF